MQHREILAHHEAAHAVMGLVFDLGVTAFGIDLDAPTRDGATGKAGVMQIDLADSKDLNDLLVNGAICAAGAVSDAKLLGLESWEAFQQQDGDWEQAFGLFDLADWEPKEGRESVMRSFVAQAATQLGKDQVWAAVEAVAQETLAAGGKLSAEAIVARAQPILAGE